MKVLCRPKLEKCKFLSIFSRIVTDFVCCFRLPEELFDQYDSSQMSFNPAIAVPRPAEPKVKKHPQVPQNSELLTYCKEILKYSKVKTEDGYLSVDFGRMEF